MDGQRFDTIAVAFARPAPRRASVNLVAGGAKALASGTLGGLACF